MRATHRRIGWFVAVGIAAAAVHFAVVVLLVEFGSLRPLVANPLAGFSECSGLEMSLQIEEFREGGNNDRLLKFPTRVTWSNLTLKKGVGSGTALWDWHYGSSEAKDKRSDGVIFWMSIGEA